MFLLNILASLVSVASLLNYAAADLRITADRHSFGGVNYPSLQYLDPKFRNEVITAIVKTNAKVIRLFIQADNDHLDPESEIGTFDRTLLDQFDDTLAAIHYISKGEIKVIIAPHNAHALRATNDVPCDAYCNHIDGAFLDFYSNLEIREFYKTRLSVFFNHYPSKNFDGKSWSELNAVILGVDVQNQPWSGIFPIVSGEPWLCDIATHLKEKIGLGKSGIAVITGGISGPQSIGGSENFPDSAFDCPAIDVIGIHGYYSAIGDATAGTPWANMFLPGNTLTSRALGKKLLMVEEWAYLPSQSGLNYKKSDVWDQGNALNYRGIPWLYSHATTKDEGTSSRISVLRESKYAIGALSDVLTRASTSRSNFDWSPFLPAPTSGLSNATHLTLNPFIVAQSPCTFGCVGHLCDAADGCKPDLMCKNSICQIPAETQPGIIGAECNSKQVCQEHLQCNGGTCQECIARPSIHPRERGVKPKSYQEVVAQAGSLHESCHADTHTRFLPSTRLRTLPFCTLPPPSTSPLGRGNPCDNAAHCSADEFCSWGRCHTCSPTDNCLGAKCKSNNKCKTGFCNAHGRCDYPGKPKIITGPGPRAGGRRGPGYNVGPKRQEGGPNRVRSEAMRVNIPTQGVRATGAPVSE
ncbi:glycoside hydrolase family 5 protein [Pleomassaria siparia CBS 279.74]|uniref:Glycoside hydrolase family 5 protein n=1 Tax=Pleomassaria siparia CBS 279.74 TaxID=1314801 RepID=A0A6G1K6E3_9PLEO|nr:glycoside hydrolase family 5 protein [Pleomassaria siparia CBS 279.74]